MKAIVGLGNPGDEYRGTRHNVGFAVVDELLARWHGTLRTWKSLADVAVFGSRDVLLAKPQTFMNLSGEAVARLAAFYKIDGPSLLVIVDEAQLPLGRIRLRGSGSAGGHNGLKSVIQHLGPEFPRMRIGVGRGDPRWDLADHVLSRFAPDERDTIEQAVQRAADAAETFIDEGLGAAMNRYNPKGDTAESP